MQALLCWLGLSSCQEQHDEEGCACLNLAQTLHTRFNIQQCQSTLHISPCQTLQCRPSSSIASESGLKGRTPCLPHRPACTLDQSCHSLCQSPCRKGCNFLHLSCDDLGNNHCSEADAGKPPHPHLRLCKDLIS